jgi:hypothetical protein
MLETMIVLYQNLCIVHSPSLFYLIRRPIPGPRMIHNWLHVNVIFSPSLVLSGTAGTEDQPLTSGCAYQYSEDSEPPTIPPT